MAGRGGMCVQTDGVVSAVNDVRGSVWCRRHVTRPRARLQCCAFTFFAAAYTVPPPDTERRSEAMHGGRPWRTTGHRPGLAIGTCTSAVWLPGSSETSRSVVQ
jgi:hypothetical protein